MPIPLVMDADRDGIADELERLAGFVRDVA